MMSAYVRISRLISTAVILLAAPLCAVAEVLYFPQPPPPERPGWEASTNAVRRGCMPYLAGRRNSAA